MTVLPMLEEDECFLWAILSDPSGLDIAEFLVTDETSKNKDGEYDGCFRAWDFQWRWWRSEHPRIIDQGSRSLGKSLSVRYRALAFPFIHPGQEMVVTAPESNHLDALTDNVENVFVNNRLPAEMLVNGRNGIKHRPFHMNFKNGARIMGRIPQRDGKGVKGCSEYYTPVLTVRGYKRAGDVVPGDTVWTHEGWHEVRSVHKSVADTCYEVSGQGSWPITVSWDHRFYGASNLADSKHKRDFSDGMWWGNTEDLVEDQFYWASPRRFDPLPVPDPNDGCGVIRLRHDLDAFWWLVGRYLADGHVGGGVHWSVHPKDQEQVIAALDATGLRWWRTRREHSSADILSTGSSGLQEWLMEHFGCHSNSKQIPGWVFGMRESHRQALLDGYLSGDGHYSEDRGRWEVGTASEFLACGLQLLAQSLGLKCSCHYVAQPNTTEIMGVELKSEPQPSYRFSIYDKGRGKAAEIDDYLLGKVKSVTNVGAREVVNIITDAHSYLTGSIMSHNIHPIWLELDEGQDYPEAGWNEIIETLKQGEDDAVWRVHGVTRGVRDKFYEYTQPDSGWEVHHYPAMYRPTWSDKEREEKIQLYGHRDNPDFRRNVYGLHGDATSPLFVLHRLMEAVDEDETSEYNMDEYWNLSIDEADIRDFHGDIIPLLDPPSLHKSMYKIFWIGMDVGYTNDPSVIVVFAEHREKKTGPSILKLLAKVSMKRVSHEHQVQAILWFIDHYRPSAFAMDKTGLGLPLFQDIQAKVRDDRRLSHVLDRIKGYGFAEKIVVELDESIEVEDYDPKALEKQEIKKTVLEHSSDVLRGLVDQHMLRLPWDRDLIGEFKGQTYSYDKATMDMYGRRKVFSAGSFHTLDACRMSALAWGQKKIEETLKQDRFEPVDAIILDF